jgi:hypothetical protein
VPILVNDIITRVIPVPVTLRVISCVVTAVFSIILVLVAVEPIIEVNFVLCCFTTTVVSVPIAIIPVWVRAANIVCIAVVVVAIVFAVPGVVVACKPFIECIEAFWFIFFTVITGHADSIAPIVPITVIPSVWHAEIRAVIVVPVAIVICFVPRVEVTTFVDIVVFSASEVAVESIVIVAGGLTSFVPVAFVPSGIIGVCAAVDVGPVAIPVVSGPGVFVHAGLLLIVLGIVPSSILLALDIAFPRDLIPERVRRVLVA